LGVGQDFEVTTPGQNLDNGSIPGNATWCLGLLQPKGSDLPGDTAQLAIPSFNQYFIVHNLNATAVAFSPPGFSPVAI
jgi:hypothetical protein